MGQDNLYLILFRIRVLSGSHEATRIIVTYKNYISKMIIFVIIITYLIIITLREYIIKMIIYN